MSPVKREDVKGKGFFWEIPFLEGPMDGQIRAFRDPPPGSFAATILPRIEHEMDGPVLKTRQFLYVLRTIRRNRRNGFDERLAYVPANQDYHVRAEDVFQLDQDAKSAPGNASLFDIFTRPH